MQPYLFPYLGYFQLVKYCDEFVFYDDVQFIKGGYINRNNILANGQKQLFTIPVVKASSNRKINEHHFSDNRGKFFKSIEQNYRKAPQFEAVMPILDKVLNTNETQVAVLCKDSILSVFNYLSIDINYRFSSELDYNKSASASEKLFEICQLINTNRYCNMKSGKSLYSKKQFAERGIELSFLEMAALSYPQNKNEYVSHLSIIDVLMWNDKSAVKALLQKYIIS